MLGQNVDCFVWNICWNEFIFSRVVFVKGVELYVFFFQVRDFCYFSNMFYCFFFFVVEMDLYEDYVESGNYYFWNVYWWVFKFNYGFMGVVGVDCVYVV